MQRSIRHLVAFQSFTDLQHQLLFDYTGNCVGVGGLPFVQQGMSCTAPQPPDHISECTIIHNGNDLSPQWVQDDAHFIEKFCPGDVTYFNDVLRLTG